MLNNQSFVSKAVDVQLTRCKMTQKALAEKAGISETYLSQLLNNKADWNLSLMDKVGSALGVDGLFGLIEVAETERRLSESSSEHASSSLEVTA